MAVINDIKANAWTDRGICSTQYNNYAYRESFKGPLGRLCCAEELEADPGYICRQTVQPYRLRGRYLTLCRGRVAVL